MRAEGFTSLAAIDSGGGVVLDDAFLIHSRTAELSVSAVTEAANRAGQHERLQVLAAHITSSLLFHDERQAAELGARAAACPSPPAEVPWFFINAAMSDRHGIAGHGDAVHTLALLLQRPWCILELCCVRDIGVLQSLLEFAQTCAVSPELSNIYSAAFELLSGELQARGSADPLVRLLGRNVRRGSRERRSRLERVSATTFRASLTSWTGIWLRAICFWSASSQASLIDVGTGLQGAISHEQILADDSGSREAAAHVAPFKPLTHTPARRHSVAAQWTPTEHAVLPFAATTPQELLRCYVLEATELIA